MLRESQHYLSILIYIFTNDAQDTNSEKVLSMPRSELGSLCQMTDALVNSARQPSPVGILLYELGVN
jgi:hypothetical protein